MGGLSNQVVTFIATDGKNPKLFSQTIATTVAGLGPIQTVENSIVRFRSGNF